MSHIERLQLIEVAQWLSRQAAAVALRRRVVIRMGSRDRTTFHWGRGAVVTRNPWACGFILLKLLIVIAVFMPVVPGCAGSPVGLMLASDKEIASTNSAVLARGYGIDRNKRCRAELERRGVFTADEWRQIDDREVRSGDTQLLVLAAWGHAVVRLNRSSTSGTVEVWDFGHHYVTFRDGVVTTITSYGY